MKKYFIACLLVLAAVVAGCSSSSDFADNGSLAVTAGSTTLTPGGGTSVSAKYTITTKVQIALAGYATTFTSSRPDLVTFSSASVTSDGTGAAVTSMSVNSDAVIPVGGLDVSVTASYNSLQAIIVIHVNPITTTTTGNSVLSLVVP